MSAFPASLETLIDCFASLPGIGQKSAQRMAFHILELPPEEAEGFAAAVLQARKTIHFCPECQSLTDREKCRICSDPARDGSVLCVVADPRDVWSVERTREFRGKYHVLHGVISPLNHVGPDDIRIRELVDRVAEGDVREVILATNPDTEGETTAKYVARLLKPFGVRTTRLASGMPVGGNLEFADDATLMRALEGRTEI